MHELAVTRSLIDLVDREAKKQGFTRALEIRLKVGAYSGIVPECILDLFPYAAGIGCPAHNAERNICPQLHSSFYKLLQGKTQTEILIDPFKHRGRIRRTSGKSC